MKKIAYILLFLVLTGLAAGYVAKREVLIVGKTMGTTYHVKVITGWYKRTGTLPEKIDQRLNEINQSMSVFRKDSELSRFNELKAVGGKFPISEDFYRVMVLAARIYEWTGHAWDGTVMPLVNLWGFGNQGSTHALPDPKALGDARRSVGFHHIAVGEDRSLSKNLESVTLDLASIAKGYGVDAVSQLLRENGFSNFLVEIGGRCLRRVFERTENRGGSESTALKRIPPPQRCTGPSPFGNRPLPPAGITGIFLKLAAFDIHTSLIRQPDTRLQPEWSAPLLLPIIVPSPTAWRPPSW